MKTLTICLMVILGACADPPGPIATNWCDRLPRPGYAALERISISDDWFEVYRVAPGVLGVRQVSVFVKGPGSGRESAVRAIQAAGIKVTMIRDVTTIPHNGCRPPKRRRV